MKARTDYEARFYHALKRIAAYMSPERLRRQHEKDYGLNYDEALEMAYENVLGEAKSALHGYRPKQAPSTTPNPPAVNGPERQP